MTSVTAGVVGLIFFFVFFVGVTVWLYRPGQKAIYQHYADIPLNEEQPK